MGGSEVAQLQQQPDEGGCSPTGRSEVAQLRQQLDEICTAMQRGLYDYAIVGKHEVITHKYEMLGKTQELLASYVGNEQAFQEVLDALKRIER
jgi:hypothetical protein